MLIFCNLGRFPYYFLSLEVGVSVSILGFFIRTLQGNDNFVLNRIMTREVERGVKSAVLVCVPHLQCVRGRKDINKCTGSAIVVMKGRELRGVNYKRMFLTEVMPCHLSSRRGLGGAVAVCSNYDLVSLRAICAKVF